MEIFSFLPEKFYFDIGKRNDQIPYIFSIKDQFMEDFFRYSVPSKEDKNWGLYIHVSGNEHYSPNMEYPSTRHPSGYYFKWDKGRVLNEYQLVYISEGKGVFENNNKQFTVLPGSMIILQPGKWHRYQPDKKTGWTEYYIGFDGEIARSIFKKFPIYSQSPVVSYKAIENIIGIYSRLNEVARSEIPAYQHIAGGLVLQLLGWMSSYGKQHSFMNKHIENVIEGGRMFIKKNYNQHIEFKKLSLEKSVSYSTFRKMFKIYTGFSPLQYQLNLRVLKAKELLLTTDKSIKEIAVLVGFQNIYYFSRLFKDKEKITPSLFRSLK